MKKNILSIISVLVFIITVFKLITLNIVPIKFLIPFIILFLILLLTGVVLYNLKKKALFIIGIILIVFNIILNITCIYYITNTNKFIKDNFTGDIKYNSSYYLITNKDNEINSIDELDENSIINYYKYSNNVEQALEQLGNYNYQEIDKIEVNDYLLLDVNNYKLLKEEYKIIYEFNIEIKEERNKDVLDSYNIYIGGRDFTRSLMDFNMIVTINNKTRTILLTNIPRDYYIDIPSYNQKDSLEFMGLLGENVIMDSLENLLDTKIDNYASIYTDGLVEIVDKIGGIDYCSDITFTTTHALVLDTYDDTLGPKLTINKGCQHLSGIETLTVARERIKVGSDRQRQKNCTKIFKSILERSLSLTTLKNYESMLNSVSNLYQTNINEQTVTNLIKNLLNNKYTIIEQSLDGTDGNDYIRLSTARSYVMYPNLNSVFDVKNKIKGVLDEK
ncbi:MAG: LCP family protein [Bacilli bacterium]|nr:LCP family protein [Bacilli bacterium]